MRKVVQMLLIIGSKLVMTVKEHVFLPFLSSLEPYAIRTLPSVRARVSVYFKLLFEYVTKIQ